MSPDAANETLASLGSQTISTGAKLSELLKRPEVSYEALSSIDKDRPKLAREVSTSVEVLIKYDGYIKRELREASRHKALDMKPIPRDIDYKKVLGLRLEAVEKLEKIRPQSLGQASRISGVNPADISVLLIYLGAK